MTREEAKENLELIKAYAEGGIIQIQRTDGGWVDLECPDFTCSSESYRIKPEETYRPYKDCDEMIADFKTRFNIPVPPDARPLIWVKNKGNKNVLLVTGFDYDNGTCKKLGVYANSSWYDFEELFNYFTYLDDTICGVKE